MYVISVLKRYKKDGKELQRPERSWYYISNNSVSGKVEFAVSKDKKEFDSLNDTVNFFNDNSCEIIEYLNTGEFDLSTLAIREIIYSCVRSISIP